MPTILAEQISCLAEFNTKNVYNVWVRDTCFIDLHVTAIEWDFILFQKKMHRMVVRWWQSNKITYHNYTYTTTYATTIKLKNNSNNTVDGFTDNFCFLEYYGLLE